MTDGDGKVWNTRFMVNNIKAAEHIGTVNTIINTLTDMYLGKQFFEIYVN